METDRILFECIAYEIKSRQTVPPAGFLAHGAAENHSRAAEQVC